MSDQLLTLPLTERSVHLCVDMQRLFTADGPWPTPWMDRVLPVVAGLAHRHPERTIFTRFIPPERAELMPGMWRRYYARWRVARGHPSRALGVDTAARRSLPAGNNH
jgi:nicotinamidase-related amidase